MKISLLALINIIRNKHPENAIKIINIPDTKDVICISVVCNDKTIESCLFNTKRHTIYNLSDTWDLTLFDIKRRIIQKQVKKSGRYLEEEITDKDWEDSLDWSEQAYEYEKGEKPVRNLR